VGGGPPMDGGRNWRDGKRVFGDGKTWRGFIGGVIIGSLAGLVQSLIEQNPSAILRGFLLSFGALLGDLTGSFIKRRLDIERGQPALGMDQLGFLAMGVFLVLLTLPWSLEPMDFSLNFIIFDPIQIRYTLENFLAYIIILFPLTFLVHISSNLLVRHTL
ncbi:MAG TPA: CDP-archaeol synthase, partial [Candidatus Hodarchaeales archaeon]|nr:CDP-archaeol synthase [Candidatus Hodarchaeales archaeon]